MVWCSVGVVTDLAMELMGALVMTLRSSTMRLVCGPEQ